MAKIDKMADQERLKFCKDNPDFCLTLDNINLSYKLKDGPTQLLNGTMGFVTKTELKAPAHFNCTEPIQKIEDRDYRDILLCMDDYELMQTAAISKTAEFITQVCTSQFGNLEKDVRKKSREIDKITDHSIGFPKFLRDNIPPSRKKCGWKNRSIRCTIPFIPLNEAKVSELGKYFKWVNQICEVSSDFHDIRKVYGDAATIRTTAGVNLAYSSNDDEIRPLDNLINIVSFYIRQYNNNNNNNNILLYMLYS